MWGEGDGAETRFEAAGGEVDGGAGPVGCGAGTDEPDAGPKHAEKICGGEGQRYEGFEGLE